MHREIAWDTRIPGRTPDWAARSETCQISPRPPGVPGWSRATEVESSSRVRTSSRRSSKVGSQRQREVREEGSRTIREGEGRLRRYGGAQNNRR